MKRLACIGMACAALGAGGLGCAHQPPVAAVRDVPFHEQARRQHCGATALRMVFDHFDIAYQPDALMAEAYVPALNGAPPELLAGLAEAHGLHARIACATPDQLARTLSAGAIPILCLPPPEGETIGHFAVLSGVSEDGRRLRVHQARRANRWLSRKKLGHGTAASGYDVLILSLPPEATKRETTGALP